MGFSRNDLKIAAMHASGATRAALEAIAGGGFKVETIEPRTRRGE